MIKGKIHSTESFGSVDGPGIRFLIFKQGCHLRCQYCHNPDTWALDEGDEMTAEELLDKAERYRSYWRDKGGITVSGGEPLVQIDFIIDLFEKAKQRGISTCIDTAAQPFTREEPFWSKFRHLIFNFIKISVRQIQFDFTNCAIIFLCFGNSCCKWTANHNFTLFCTIQSN